MDVLLERLALAHAHHALCGPHCERRISGDLAGHVHRHLHQLVAADHMVDEPEFEAFVGVQGAPGEGQFGRFCVADDAGEQPRAAALGDDAALGEGGGQLRGGPGDADVAAEGEVHPVSCSATVEGGNSWRIDLVEHDRRRIAHLELARVAGHLETGALGLGPDVEARTPCLALAGDHDAPDVRIAVGLQQQCAQLLEHRPRDGVHPVGAVEGEDGDVAVDLVTDLRAGGFVAVVVHARILAPRRVGRQARSAQDAARITRNTG